MIVSGAKYTGLLQFEAGNSVTPMPAVLTCREVQKVCGW